MDIEKQVKITKKFRIRKVDEKLAECPIIFVEGDGVKSEQDKLVCCYEKKAGIVYKTQCGGIVVGLHKNAKYCTYCGRWIRIEDSLHYGSE